MRDRPRRIAELFAGTPYRALALNCPYDFEHLIPGLNFSGKKVNEMAAVSMLNGQAPIIYADDVENNLVDMSVEDCLKRDIGLNDSLVKQVMKMMSAPRSIPPYDNMFIDVALGGDDSNKKDIQDKFDNLTTEQKVENIKQRVLYTNSGVAAFIQIDPLQYLFPKSRDHVHEQMCIFYTRSYLGMRRQALGMPKEHIEYMNTIEAEDKEFQDLLARMKTLKYVGIYPYIYNDINNNKRPVGVHGPWGMSIYILDENYKIMQVEGAPPGCNMMCHFDFKDLGKDVYDKATFEKAQMVSAAFSDRIVAVVVQTISLLNCSNVHLIETGKTNQDRTKKQLLAERLASVRHHELRVKVGEQYVRVDGRTEQGNKLCPLHTVRGHFKDYSTGKGLFGKYHYSCVWCPPFVRGNVEDGIVTRDYVLEQGK